MVSKRQEIRADLTQRLLEAAVKRVEADGLLGLKARDVTSDAGCALGTLYKCYQDLDALIIEVNTRTLETLLVNMSNSVEGIRDPQDQLKILAQTYLEFAQKNENLWKALFLYQSPDSEMIPQSHQQLNEELLKLIAKPLFAIDQHLNDQELQARTRTYFAAVHGVVSVAMQKRFISVPPDQLSVELDSLVMKLSK